jgi:glutamine cyclotransferase
MYDFTGLVNDLESEDEYKNLVDPFFGSVLNGIAYHRGSKRLIMGGKKWPYWYEIELIEEEA